MALGLAEPTTRYALSSRAYPEHLPVLEYAPYEEARKVQTKCEFSFRGKEIALDKAFTGTPIAVRRTTEDEIRSVYFGTHHVATINLKCQAISSEKARLERRPTRPPCPRKYLHFVFGTNTSP